MKKFPTYAAAQNERETACVAVAPENEFTAREVFARLGEQHRHLQGEDVLAL